jgi:hypothetical protein
VLVFGTSNHVICAELWSYLTTECHHLPRQTEVLIDQQRFVNDDGADRTTTQETRPWTSYQQETKMAPSLGRSPGLPCLFGRCS